jgi:hypothetical protein
MKGSFASRLASGVAGALLVALGSASVEAQDSVAIELGARIRLRSDTTTPWVYGRFGGWVADSIVLQPPRRSAPRRIAIGALEQIDVRQVDRARHGRNTMIGALAGVGATTIALGLAIRHCERANPRSDGPPCGLGWAALPVYALGGAIVGGVAGRLWPTRRWQPVILVPRR